MGHRITASTVVAFVMGLAFVSISQADPTSVSSSFQSSLSYEYGSETTGRSLSQTIPPVTAMVFKNDADITLKGLESGQLKFSASLETRQYADARYALSNRASLRLEYRSQTVSKLQWRAQFSYDRTWLGEEWNYDRYALGVRLKYQHDQQHSTRAHLRYRYRNQNDLRFQGYDQSEYLLELSHEIRPAQSKWSISGTVHAEYRDAEASRYSYHEVGAGLKAKYKLSGETNIQATVKGFSRRYQSASSGTIEAPRNDGRFEVKLGVNHKFSDRLTGFGYVGWRRNNSNVATRNYADPRAGLGLRLKW